MESAKVNYCDMFPYNFFPSLDQIEKEMSYEVMIWLFA